MTTAPTRPAPPSPPAEELLDQLVTEIEQLPAHERLVLLYWGELGETLCEVISSKGTPAMRTVFVPVADPVRRARLQELSWDALLRIPPARRRALDPTQSWPLINQAVRASGLSADLCLLVVAAATAAETPEAVASIPIQTPAAEATTPTEEH